MKTVIVKKTSLPDFLPHGWKTQVARALGKHPNTIQKALKKGRGETYERIKKVAIEKWGKS